MTYKFTLDGIEFETDSFDLAKQGKEVNAELLKLRADSEKLSARSDSDKTTISDLQAQLKAAQDENAQLLSSLDTAQTKLDSLQLDYDDLQSRGDSADSSTPDVEKILAQHMPERMQLWQEVLPMFRSDDMNFEPDYLMTPVQIMTAAIKFANPELEEHLDSLDLTSAESQGAVKGMYAMLNPAQFAHNSAKRKDSLDDVLSTIKRNRADGGLQGADENDNETRMKKARSNYTRSSK